MKYTSKLILNGQEYLFAAPSGGWQPGANTIAYYPLDSTNTVNDLSGNSLNGTQNGTISFGVNLGVDCATFNGGANYISIPYNSVMSTDPCTVSVFLSKSNSSDHNKGAFSLITTFSNESGVLGLANFHDTNSGSVLVNSNHESGQFTMFDGVNKWSHIVVTYNNGQGKVYVNGTLTKTFSTSMTQYTNRQSIIGGYFSDDYCWQGTISKLIRENKERTQQEISDYFNQTKSLYGIS